MTFRTPSYVLLLIGLLFATAGCRKSLLDVPLPSEITKTHREAIGAYVQEQLAAQPEFEILTPTEQNAAAYELVQELYLQATNVMRLDNKSPDANRWSANRLWQVYIINDVQHTAFVLPGGDLYISTGLLRSLQSESELYGILATEAIVMNEKYLLEKMIIAYSTKTLVQIAEGDALTDSRIESISYDVPMFSYLLDFSEEIKTKVYELICDSSIYTPRAILNLKSRLSTSDQWLSTRPIGLSNLSELDCGNVETTGLYQSMILDVL